MNIIIDNGLELRQLKQSDSKDIFATIDSQREYLGKWLPFVEFTKVLSDTERFVTSVINAPQDRFEYIFTIRKGDEFAGLIGFKDTDSLNHKTEIGYWLSEKHQKQGIATRAVEKLCAFAFENLRINRVQIKCAVGNIPSKNIPKRLGFQLEGTERQGELLSDGTYTDLEIYSKLKQIKMKGYTQVYTGNGKGKTTAAFGLALRAIGAGKKVFFAQFVKGKTYAEIEAVKKFLPNFIIKQYGLGCFIVNKPTPRDIEAAQKGLKEVTQIIESGYYDVVVLDEATIALYYNLFTIEDLLETIHKKPSPTELIITGRYAPPEVLDIADLVTEMKEVKHYYQKGVEAREGIEF